MGWFVVPLHSIFFPLKQSEPFATASPSSTPLSFSPSVCPTLTPLSPALTYVVNQSTGPPGALNIIWKIFIPHLGCLFHPQFVAQSQKATWDLRNVHALQKTRLQPIHLAFHPFLSLSKAPRDGCAAPHSFSSPLFLLPPSIPFYSILPPHSSSFALSALLLPLQRLSFSAVSISLPRAQRQFSRSSPGLFHPLFLSLCLSLTRVWRSYWYSRIQTA